MEDSSDKLGLSVRPTRQFHGVVCTVYRVRLRHTRVGSAMLHLLSVSALLCLVGCKNADALRLSENSIPSQGPAAASLLGVQPLRELVHPLEFHSYPPSLRHLRFFVAAPLSKDASQVAATRGNGTIYAKTMDSEGSSEQSGLPREPHSMVLAILSSRIHEGLPRDPPEIFPSGVPAGASVISSLFRSSSPLSTDSAPNVTPPLGTLVLIEATPAVAGDTSKPCASPGTLPPSSSGVADSSSSCRLPASCVPSASLLTAAASAASCCDALVMPLSYPHLGAPLSLLGQREPHLLLLSASVQQQFHMLSSFSTRHPRSGAAERVSDVTDIPVEASGNSATSPLSAPLPSHDLASQRRSDGRYRGRAREHEGNEKTEPCSEYRCANRTFICDHSELEKIVTKRKPLIILVTDYTEVSPGEGLAEKPILPVVALRAGSTIEDLSLGFGSQDDPNSLLRPQSFRRRSSQKSSTEEGPRTQRKETAAAVRRLLESLCHNLDWPSALKDSVQNPDEKTGAMGERVATKADQADHSCPQGQGRDKDGSDDANSSPNVAQHSARNNVEGGSLQREKQQGALETRQADRAECRMALDSLYSTYVVFVPLVPVQALDDKADPEQKLQRHMEALQIAQRLQRTVEEIVSNFQKESASPYSSGPGVSLSSESPLHWLPQVAAIFERVLGESSGGCSVTASRDADSSCDANDRLPVAEVNTQAREMNIEARRSTWATVRDIQEAVSSGKAEEASKVMCEYALRKIKDETKERFDALLNLQSPAFHVGYSRSFPAVASELRRAVLQLFDSSAQLVREQMMKNSEIKESTENRNYFSAAQERMREELDREITRTLSPRYFLQLNALRAEITRQFRSQLDHIQKDQLVALEAYLMSRQQPGVPQAEGVDREETVPELLSFRRFSRLIQALLKAAGTTFLSEMRRFHRSCSPSLLRQLTLSFEPLPPSSSSSSRASRRILELVEQRQHLRLLDNLREMASSVIQQQQMLLSEYASGLKGGIWSTNPITSWILDGFADTSERIRESRPVQAVVRTLATAERQSPAVRTLLGWWRRRAPVEVSLQYVSPTAFGLSNFRRRVGLSPEEAALTGQRTSLKGRIQKLWSGAEASSRASPSPNLAPILDEALEASSLLRDLSRLSSLMVYGQSPKNG
ncbi:hypothetical protein TGVEG_289000 [Toxoplasma gondii VEG]|uniref:Uncharacterized protein n=3 Tax=Toxoplasma gondii TaxID=5811 RepID=V4ZIU4_TOXGV|nr:hypothetical protein TGVEG_289000 [Toxoplasma gondii VEG]KFG32989.1 hypothetical protein TGP89_289000 [Toxoplasma gondii p89]